MRHGRGVVSICMARTEEGLRRGERVLVGVLGEETRWSPNIDGSRDSGRIREMSSSEC